MSREALKYREGALVRRREHYRRYVMDNPPTDADLAEVHEGMLILEREGLDYAAHVLSAFHMQRSPKRGPGNRNISKVRRPPTFDEALWWLVAFNVCRQREKHLKENRLRQMPPMKRDDAGKQGAHELLWIKLAIKNEIAGRGLPEPGDDYCDKMLDRLRKIGWRKVRNRMHLEEARYQEVVASRPSTE